MVKPSAISMRGTARTSVPEVNAYQLPNAPRIMAPSAAAGSYPLSAKKIASTARPAPSDATGRRRPAARESTRTRRVPHAAPPSMSEPISARDAPGGASRSVPRAITTIRWPSVITSSRSLE